MAEKKSDSEQLIDVYEASTGNTYDRGVGAAASREKFKTWRSSPAARTAWTKHVAARAAPKPDPTPTPEAAKTTPKPSPTPTPKAPDSEGQTGKDAAGALGRPVRGGANQAWTGEQEAERKRLAELDAKVKFQGKPAKDIIKPGEGIGAATDAARRRREAARKAREEEDDE